MPTTRNSVEVSAEALERLIFWVRGERVILDSAIARLYRVDVKRLNQAVRRNRKRFPTDFLIELTSEETRSLRSQFVTLDPPPKAGSTSVTPRKRGSHSKYAALAFTEQGVAMLSSVLRSDRAIQVNVEIMRAFVRLRHVLGTRSDLAARIDELEKRHEGKFRIVFDALRVLMEPPRVPQRRLIGFRTGRPTRKELARAHRS
jgi:hypothetical protein